nr:MAG TPA: hypothetical protein [Caudoviricetes sp.]
MKNKLNHVVDVVKDMREKSLIPTITLEAID